MNVGRTVGRTVGRPLRRELKRLGGREMLVVGAPANSPNNSPSDPPSDAPSDAPPRSKPRAVGLPSALQVFLLTTAGENTLAAIHHALASERPSRALLFVESGKSVDAELRLLREAGLREAIHVKESRAAEWCVRSACREPQSHEMGIVVIGDNLGVVLSLARGRSADFSMLLRLREICAQSLATGVRFYFR